MRSSDHSKHHGTRRAHGRSHPQEPRKGGEGKSNSKERRPILIRSSPSQFLEKFQECVDWVQKNERDFVYRYELHRGIKEQNGKEQFVVLEQ